MNDSNHRCQAAFGLERGVFVESGSGGRGGGSKCLSANFHLGVFFLLHDAATVITISGFKQCDCLYL